MRRHGLRPSGRKTKTYAAWVAMRQRCNNPNHHAFADYGGRWITVCARWDDYATFLADMGEAPAGQTLDRKNVNGNYEAGNCRWATRAEQSRNQRSTVLNETIARQIRELAAAGIRACDIARRLSLSGANVGKVIRGERWSERQPSC